MTFKKFKVIDASCEDARRVPHAVWRDIGTVGMGGEGVGGHSLVILQGFGGEYAQKSCSID